MKRVLLALILALPLALSAQFRIVGTGLFTTLNDSTYRAKIDFRPDLTGNSYNATQLNDSMLVLSQKGQLYRLDSFYNASFSSAFIIVVEKNGNWGSPVGQVMVFQNNSSLAAPQAVYGANGATAGMQAGVDTWNSLLLKVVSDSAVYWNQAYSNSIDSLNVSGDSLKTITLYRAGGDSISATFVDGGGSGPVTDTLHGEVKGPLDSTYIDTVANIIFTTTTDTTVGVGELEYNDTQGSLIQGLKGGNVTNVIGQQIHQRVTNATGGSLTKGTAVFLHGSQGNRITVRKALATADSTSANTFGIVAESIANNQSGYVITEGLITNMNTNALTEGAAVYLSPTVAGELTTTKPQAPQHTVYIGVCVKQNAGSGELFIKIRNGQELDELHDVRITSPDSSASLYYNAAQGVWRDTGAAVLVADTTAMLTNYINVVDTAAMLTNYINVADTATMLSSYISNADTSVFARDFQISGTANRLAMFTGSNTVGNSIVTQNGRSMYINSTQDNSAFSLSNSFQFNGFGSNNTDQPSIGVFGNTGTNPGHRPYLAMYRSFGDTANSKTLVPYNSYLGSIVWHGADGVNLASRGAEIGAITDSITGVTDMPTALFFGTTTNGAASPTERMRITSPGNVGINTTTPAYRLDVNGDVNTTGMYKKSGTDIISGTTNYIPKFTGANTIGNSVIQDNGTNVGISASPSSFKLDINGSTHTTGDFYADRAARSASAGFVSAQTNSRWLAGMISNSGNWHVYDLLRSTSVMTLDSATGNVGIATSSPSRPLHINANSSMIIPSGATGTRPAVGASGDIRFNSDSTVLEFYDGTGWRKPIVTNRSDGKGANGQFYIGDASGFADISSNLFWTSGKLAVNRTLPSSASDSTLYVEGGATITTGIRSRTLTGGTAANDTLILSGTTGTSNTATRTNIGFNVGDNSATRAMTILNNGRVGIGTTTPGVGYPASINPKLHIYGGGGGIRTSFVVEDTGYTSAARFSMVNAIGSQFSIQLSSPGFTFGRQATIGTTDNTPVVLGTNGTLGSGGGGSVMFRTGGFTDAQIRLEHDSIGNTIMGGRYPKNRLDVKGATVIGDSYAGVNTAPANGLLVEGKVGIGTTSPTAVLHLLAGTASANTAPLKFTSGTNLTTAEAGAVEWNGTNVFVTNSSARRQTVNQGLTNSATMDFPNTDAQKSSDLTIAVTGASDGDVVSLGVSNTAVNANTCYTAWVSAADTVTIRFNNYSTGAINPASATFKVFVTKF